MLMINKPHNQRKLELCETLDNYKSVTSFKILNDITIYTLLDHEIKMLTWTLIRLVGLWDKKTCLTIHVLCSSLSLQ